jgi:hypothetical protein
VANIEARLIARRRTFLKAGIAGVALTLAQRSSQAQVELRADVKGADAKDSPEDLNVIVIGTDGSVPAKSVVDKYLAAHADVWHYLPNRPQFSQILEFLDSDPRIKLGKSTRTSANKQAGKVSMVVGWQDCFALEEENGNEWRFSRPPQTKLREYYELGLRTANLCYQLSNQFGGGMLDPEARLTTQGRYIVGKMQDLGILVDVSDIPASRRTSTRSPWLAGRWSSRTAAARDSTITRATAATA